MQFKIINISDIKGFHLGNAEDKKAGTGCTVIISDKGAIAGVDVRGGAPSTRETDLLKSENSVQKINAVVISGGSSFGLEASSGVMNYLERKNIGYILDNIRVPIVCAASLFDLNVGSSEVRPDKEMGETASENAYKGNFSGGNFGAGTGTSVGKIYEIDRAMKTGLGTFACRIDKLEIGAISAVNAIGDIYDGDNNIIAGPISKDGTKILNSMMAHKDRIFGTDYENSNKNINVKMCNDKSSNIDSNSIKDESLLLKIEGRSSEGILPIPDNSNPNEIQILSDDIIFGDEDDMIFNTTISCLITNAKLTKPEANKLSSILHDAYARAIKPVHSSLDGDTIFVMTTSEIDVDFDSFAALSTDILQYAIIDSARNAHPAYGLKASSSFKKEEENDE